jgi:DNA (cytosine-5)-methyltransferase 3A
LFDGISCGRVALENAGYAVSAYEAFEIDKYARAIARYNFPDTRHHGDVLDAEFNKFLDYDIVMGGSPCTFWSIAKSNREVDKSGKGWKLFMRFVEAVRIINPRFFFYENVASMPAPIKEFISEEFGYEPILINSALVSAQQRKRLYWTNIKGIIQPADKGILLKDILESGIPYQEKSHCLTATYNGAEIKNSLERKQRTMIAEPITVGEEIGAALRTRTDENGSFKRLEVRKDGKQNALTTVRTDSIVCVPIRVGQIGTGGQGSRIYSVQGKTISLMANGGGRGAKTGLYKIDLPDGDYIIRKLTPIEAERCQTLPDNYTAFGIDDAGKTVNISNTQRYKAIGNGWTVDVIAYVISHVN